MMSISKRVRTPGRIETEWNVEFEASGEGQVRDTAMSFGTATYPMPKRLFALRWLREQEKARKDRVERKRRHLRWTLAAVIVGIIGTALTWLVVTPRASSVGVDQSTFRRSGAFADRGASGMRAATSR